MIKFKEYLEEGGLWANIHAKRKRIKNGSGERMRKPGSKGAPTDADFKAANEEVEIDEAHTTVHVPRRFKHMEDSIHDAIHKAHGSPKNHNIGVEFNSIGKREVEVDGKKHAGLTIALNNHLDGKNE